MKRKEGNDTNGGEPPAKRVACDVDVRDSFRKGLFEPDVLRDYTQAYATSKP